MQPPIKGFWGKAKTDRDTGNLLAWHPLVDHCLDVAITFRFLIGLPGNRARLEQAAGHPLTDTQLDRLAVIALIHDLGKCNRGFQGKIFPGGARFAGHVRELGPLFADEALFEQLAQMLALDTLCEWFTDEEDFEALLLAAFSHHGRPVVSDELQTKDRRHTDAAVWWRADNNLDPWQGIAELMDNARRAFPNAFQTPEKPIHANPALQHRFAGFLMLADWIGSHTGFFPYRQDRDEDRVALARRAAENALQEIGLDTRIPRATFQARSAEPRDLFGFETLSPLQARLAAWSLDDDNRLLIVESETGSGKTEAAIARFFQLYAADAVDGLYFALPTRVAARELYGRVVDYITRAFPETPLSPVLLAVPGYTRVDGERVVLPEPKHLWQDDAQEQHRERVWAAEHSKRFLAAPVAVGTVDQALLSALQVKHAHLRSVCLDRQLLIIDEIHASDPYMRYLLKFLLTHHLGLGGHAVLLSATLGESARARWLDTEPLPLSEATALPYPSVAIAGARPLKVDNTQNTGKTVQVQQLPVMGEPSAVIELLVAALDAGARMLVVMNTVGRAMDMQRRLEADSRIQEAHLFHAAGVICPHHGRYARVDREIMDTAVSSRFGKGSDPGPVVIVGTQTLEQSLDIDADLLITDLCPMDVLLQRIGRLHRHRAERAALRPTGFEEARCLLITPEDTTLESFLKADGSARGDAGLGSVYSDLRVLRLTLDTLANRPEIEIPKDNRWLVEQALHPERLATLDGEVWRKHGQQQDGITMGQELQADLVVLKTTPFGELRFADLNNQVRTRLGLDDRRYEFPDGVVSPFAQALTDLVIPGHMKPRGDAETIDAVQTDADGLRFTIGQTHYRYTRLGLEKLDESTH